LVLRSIVDRKLTLLDRYIGFLEELARRPLEAFRGDFLACGAARYYLQAAIECCADVATHIIASDTARRVESYRETFRALGEEGVLTAETAAAMDPAAALRNRLVHGYDRVDDARVHEMLTTAPPTLRRFLREVALYLDR
jgi:uncharacterized protein YutE (UPF0331/DUF86 family)